MSRIIRIKNLVKQYGGRIALDHLDLEVDKGAVLGLLGPNGAGKSTLVAILNGLTSFQEGDVEVFGLRLGSNIKDIRRRSAFIPQSLALYENLTVQENLQFFAKLQKIDNRRLGRNFDYALAVCRLQPLLQRKAADLSGGQQQRLNIAIGLLNEPELLYFDEPTAGIDPERRSDILHSIAQLAAEGRTIVYTSHYLSEIEKICDTAAIIHQGKIIRQGPMTELLRDENPGGAVVDLAGRVPEHLAAELAACSASSTDAATLTVQRATAANIAALLAILERENIAVKNIRYGMAGLEALYLRITSEGGADV